MIEKLKGHIPSISILCAAAVLGALVYSHFHYRQNHSTDSRTGSELSIAGHVNTEVTGEQQRTLERTQRSIDTVETIRGITEATNISIRELRDANRRSSDISEEIREEARLLEDYFRSISDLISNSPSD